MVRINDWLRWRVRAENQKCSRPLPRYSEKRAAAIASLLGQQSAAGADLQATVLHLPHAQERAGAGERDKRGIER